MENLLEKMFSTEFEHLITAELTRTLKENILVTDEGDRLMAVLYALLD